MFIFEASWGVTCFEVSLYEYNLKVISDVSPTLRSVVLAVAFKNNQFSIFVFSPTIGFML